MLLCWTYLCWSISWCLQINNYHQVKLMWKSHHAEQQNSVPRLPLPQNPRWQHSLLGDCSFISVQWEEVAKRRPSLFRSMRDCYLTLRTETNETLGNLTERCFCLIKPRSRHTSCSVLHRDDVLIKQCERFNDSSLIFARLFSLVFLQQVQHWVWERAPCGRNDTLHNKQIELHTHMHAIMLLHLYAQV